MSINYGSLIQDFNGSSAILTSRTILYGEPGSGKTRLASSWPGKILFIDADRGMRSIPKEGSEKIKYVRLPEWDKTKPRSMNNAPAFEVVVSILQDALSNTGPFAAGQVLDGVKTIVMDSFSSLVDEFMLRQILADTGAEKAGYDEYGLLKAQLIQIGILIKDVSDTKFIVATAIPDEEKDALTGTLQGKPGMTGKYRDAIGGVFDEEYYLESTDTGGGKQKYMLYAAKYRHFEAKTRLLNVNRLDVTNAGYELIKANYRIGGTAGATGADVKPTTTNPNNAPQKASYAPNTSQK